MLIGKNNHLFQHIDITPSVLNLLGVNKTIISFGNNAFSAKEKFIVNYVNNTYQIAEGEYFLQLTKNATIGFYHTAKDSLLQHNLIEKSKLRKKHLLAKKQLENKLKAIIQQYNNRLINNDLTFNE